MRSTIFLRNIIGKAAYIFLIAIIPLQCHFNTNAVISIHGKVKDVIQMSFAFVNVFYKLRQTTFIVVNVFQINPFIT